MKSTAPAPNIFETLTIVDVDSHVSEPPDLWTARMSGGWGDEIPHLVHMPEKKLPLSAAIAGAAAVVALLLTAGSARPANPPTISVVLTGQALIQADTRTDTPTAVQRIRPLLNGDVVFTNLEATVAEKGDDLSGFNLNNACVAPPAALDVLSDMGINLIALSNNHSSNLGMMGILNTIREVKARKLANAGIGMNLG